MSKKPAPKKHVHSHHVQPTMAKGAAPTREKIDGAEAGVNHGGTYVPGAQESGPGTVGVSGPVREPAIDRAQQEADKVKLFTRRGPESGNGDNVARPGMSGRDWQPNDLSEVSDESH